MENGCSAVRRRASSSGARSYTCPRYMIVPGLSPRVSSGRAGYVREPSMRKIAATASGDNGGGRVGVGSRPSYNVAHASALRPLS